MAGLSTRVINADTADHARRNKEDIWKGVAKDVNALLLTPEQLKTAEFDKLVNDQDFQRRLVALGVDEVHLLDTWGKTFRTAFKQIGPSRMRFMNNPVLIALTATLRAGAHMRSVCQFLGLQPGSYYLIRRSNMRYDIQLDFRTLTSPARGICFPELDWVLLKERRVIVFCPTIALSFRVAHYLWQKSEDLPDHAQRIRMYNALNWPTYNTATLGFMHNDARARVTVATDTLSVGIDASHVDDVVLFDFELPVNSDVILQKAGRIRNGEGRSSMVVVFQPKDAPTRARASLGMPEPEGDGKKGQGRKRTRTTSRRDQANEVDSSTARLILAECKVAEIDRLYDNPSEELPCMCQTCKEHPRPTRPEHCNCSGCRRPGCDIADITEAARTDSEDSPIEVASSESNDGLAQVLEGRDAPPTGSRSCRTRTGLTRKPPRITQDMRKYARKELRKFRLWVYDGADDRLQALDTPECFLPDVLIDVLIDDLHALVDIHSLQCTTVNYERLQGHYVDLLKTIEQIRQEFTAMREAAKKARNAKAKATRERNRAEIERVGKGAQTARSITATTSAVPGRRGMQAASSMGQLATTQITLRESETDSSDDADMEADTTGGSEYGHSDSVESESGSGDSDSESSNVSASTARRPRIVIPGGRLHIVDTDTEHSQRLTIRIPAASHGTSTS